MKKISFFIFAFLNVNYILTENIINKLWPYIDSIDFPFPTPDPIDIPTSRAKHVFTPVPLIVLGSLIYFSKATQTGSTLIVRVPPPPSATGGVLYKNVYGLFQREFFWDLALKRSAAMKIDGYGASLQVVNTLYNMKYPSVKVAMKKRDGIAQVVNFINVTSVFNPLFYPTQKALHFKLEKANSSAIISEFFNFDYLFTLSIINEYFCYPGSFTDPDTGVTYFSSTTIVPVRKPTPEISLDQFNDVFGWFKNEKGKSYSNVRKLHPVGRRPIKKANGVILAVSIR